MTYQYWKVENKPPPPSPKGVYQEMTFHIREGKYSKRKRKMENIYKKRTKKSRKMEEKCYEVSRKGR
jgi:hypothetical protein